jgi:hypothetical protein
MSAAIRRWHFSDTGLLVALLIAVVVTAVLLPQPSSTPTARRTSASVQSKTSSGAMTLRLWLEQMGYQTKVLTASRVNPAGCDVLFVLEPYYPYTAEDAQLVAQWVADGHTLIVANGAHSLTTPPDAPPAANSLLTPYGMTLTNWPPDSPPLIQTGPALSNPPFDIIKTSGTISAVATSRTDAAVHLVSSSGKPVVMSIFHGSGTVWVMGTVYPFTNEGLTAESDARFILNLLAPVPDGATIGFEEGLRLPATGQQTPSSSGGLIEWVLTSRAGRSILAALALVMVFLLLRGRRFGQPIPLAQEHLRREPVEFIAAMANLMRRSGQRTEALRHYRAELQRVLAHRYAVDPHTPAAELVRVVAQTDPTIDTAALAKLLQDLSRPSVSEQDLVRLALEVHTWIGDRT